MISDRKMCQKFFNMELLTKSLKGAMLLIIMKKIVFVFLMFLFTISARAELHISVDGAKSDPTPVAITPFVATTPTELAELVPQIVAADLQRSHLFRVIDQEAYIEKMDNFKQKQSFS